MVDLAAMVGGAGALAIDVHGIAFNRDRVEKVLQASAARRNVSAPGALRHSGRCWRRRSKCASAQVAAASHP